MINLVGPQYEPLTPEEEQELWPQAKQGNEKARERLICSTLRSVVKECYKYVNAYDVDELISMGLYMAVECFDTYDPAKGVKFYAYITLRVRWKIGDMLREEKNTVHTDNINILEAFGGYEETPDTDEERRREERNETIRNYFLSLPQMTPEKLDDLIKEIQETDYIAWNTTKALKRITEPTPEILKAIEELIGADTAAKALAPKEKQIKQTPEQKKQSQKQSHKRYLANHPEQRERYKEYLREYSREYYKRKKEAARLAQAEQPQNNPIQARMRREQEKAHTKELKPVERQKTTLQRIMEKQKTERQTAVDNFNTLYEFIITHTDARPMEAEAAAYMTLQGFDTLKAWSARHGLVYESVKRWRMYVKKKLAALADVDEDIIALDRSLFKS